MANEAYIGEWMRKVSTAALSFESRWTMRALRRVNPDLHEAMSEQLVLYHTALVTGERKEVDEHAAATIRGYIAVTGALQESGEPDDAYVLGFDSRTGTRIAIGDQKACVERVRHLPVEGREDAAEGAGAGCRRCARHILLRRLEQYVGGGRRGRRRR